jgi:hypothetical protein
MTGVTFPASISSLLTLGIAALFAILIVMVVLTLNLDQSIDRWANIVVAAVFFLFNVVGVPTIRAGTTSSSSSSAWCSTR